MPIITSRTTHWLTDISATRAQDGLADGYDKAEEARQAFLTQLQSFEDGYRCEANTAGVEKLATVRKAFDAYCEAGRSMAEAAAASGPGAGNKMIAEFDASSEELTESLQDFSGRVAKMIKTIDEIAFQTRTPLA